MIRDVRLWGLAVIISSVFLAVLTPDRIGERLWNVVKLPAVLLLVGTWGGFVLAIIGRKAAPNVAGRAENGEVDLTAAASPGDILVTSARLGVKVAIGILGIICAVQAVWDWLFRASPEWLRGGIWSIAAVSLGVHLVKLAGRRVILSPASISWTDHGQIVSRGYQEVTDFQVLSRSEIRVVFSDGKKLSITSDTHDLKKVLATITARRIA